MHLVIFEKINATDIRSKLVSTIELLSGQWCSPVEFDIRYPKALSRLVRTNWEAFDCLLYLAVPWLEHQNHAKV
jgi:hypothetical protein